MPDTRTKPIIQCLQLLIKFYGNLIRIITNRGKRFTSKEIENFCQHENIKHVLNAIASLRSNGQVKIFNSTILDSLSASINDLRESWENHLINVQRGMNMTVNATTGQSPSELLHWVPTAIKI